MAIQVSLTCFACNFWGKICTAESLAGGGDPLSRINGRALGLSLSALRELCPGTEYNKCIEDDTKAAARQSPNCIKKTKKNKIRRKTIFNMADGILSPRNVARGPGTTCLRIRPNVRHIGILLLVSISTISPQSRCQSAKFYPNPAAVNDVMSIFKMTDLRHLGF